VLTGHIGMLVVIAPPRLWACGGDRGDAVDEKRFLPFISVDSIFFRSVRKS